MANARIAFVWSDGEHHSSVVVTDDWPLPGGEYRIAAVWSDGESESTVVVSDPWQVGELGVEGDLYYVIYPSALANPTAAQVIAGKDATGATAVAAGATASRRTNGRQVFPSAADLTAGTSYRVAVVWYDGTNYSNVVVSDHWSTLAAGARLKRWDGSAWISAEMQRHDGMVWVLAPLKFWNGSSWEQA